MRHREQDPARAAGHGQCPGLRERRCVVPGAGGPEERPVRGRVRDPQQRPVQRPGLQRAPCPDGDRAGAALLLVPGPGRAEHQVPQFLKGDRAERVPPVPGRPRRAGATAAPTERGPGPRPARRSRPIRASGHQVIKTMTRIMNAPASSLSRFPFTNRAPSGARPAITLTASVPGLSSSGPSVA